MAGQAAVKIEPESEHVTLQSIAAASKNTDESEYALLKDILGFKSIAESVSQKGEKPLYIKDFVFNAVKP